MINTLKINKMKKFLFTIVCLLGFFANSFAYDFTAVCESGQTLYYNILSESEKTVELTYAEYFNAGYYQWYTYYYEVTAPSGDLVIPEKVQYNGEDYTVVNIGDNAFNACNLSSVIFPNSIISIGDGAFASDTHVSLIGELHLPDYLQTIGSRAFEWNTALTAVYIPNSVRSIGSWSFYTCVGLNYLYLGSGVEEISFEAFSNCTGLDSITIDRATPPICQYSSFRYVPKGIPVYVPCNTIELYQNTEFWNEFTNFVEDCTLFTDEYSIDDITVSCYPNPVTDYLRIEGVYHAKVQVFNAIGQLVKETKENVIDLSTQEAGTYILKLITPSGVVTKQIIKN